MIWFLRIASLVGAALVGIIIVQSSLEQSLLAIPKEVTANVWFQTMLYDFYVGIFFFWLWVAWRGASWWRASIWLILFVGLGNLATGVYLAIAAWSASPKTSVADFLTGPRRS